MAIGPIDYYSQYAPNIGGSLLQGLQIGGQLSQLRGANQAANQAADYKKQQQDLIMGVMNNPDASYEEIMQVAALTNSNELAEVARYKKQGIDKSYVGALGTTYASLLNNNTEAAKTSIRQARDAAINSKNDELAAEYSEIYNAIDKGENLPEISDRLKTTMLLFPSGREIVNNILPKESMELGKRKDIAITKKAEAEAVTAEGAKELQALQTEEAAFKVESAKWDEENKKIQAQIAKDTLKNEIELAQAKTDEAKNKALLKQAELETQKGDRLQQYEVKKTMAEQLNDDIKWLRSKENRDYVLQVIGTSGALPTMPGTPYRDAQLRMNRVAGINTAGNLKLMTGVLTQSDLLFLKSISSGFESGSEGMVLSALASLEKNSDKRMKTLEEGYKDVKNAKAKESSLDDEATSLGLP